MRIEKPEEVNVILGHAHFIKTVEDLHETIVQSAPFMKFGLAFAEASGPCLIRYSGNDESLMERARSTCLALAAGHTFIIFLTNGFPINVLNAIKAVPEVVRIYCATANPTDVILVETDLGRAIVGVVDGASPLGVETEADIVDRKGFLRKIGYKL